LKEQFIWGLSADSSRKITCRFLAAAALEKGSFRSKTTVIPHLISATT